MFQHEHKLTLKVPHLCVSHSMGFCTVFPRSPSVLFEQRRLVCVQSFIKKRKGYTEVKGERGRTMQTLTPPLAAVSTLCFTFSFYPLMSHKDVMLL